MTVCSTSPSMTSSSESICLGPHGQKGWPGLEGSIRQVGLVVQLAPSTRGRERTKIQLPLCLSCGLPSPGKWSTFF